MFNHRSKMWQPYLVDTYFRLLILNSVCLINDDIPPFFFLWQFATYSKFVPGEHRHVKLTLCSWLPMRQKAQIVGHHLSNSDFQSANVDFGKITRRGPAISLKCFMYPSKEMVCKVLPRPCYNKKKLVNVFKACWWISPRAYFAFFFLARRKAKYYPSQIVLKNSSWELGTLRKKSDVNNFLTISSVKIPLIPFSNSEISQLRPLNL